MHHFHVPGDGTVVVQYTHGSSACSHEHRRSNGNAARSVIRLTCGHLVGQPVLTSRFEFYYCYLLLFHLLSVSLFQIWDLLSVGLYPIFYLLSVGYWCCNNEIPRIHFCCYAYLCIKYYCMDSCVSDA